MGRSRGKKRYSIEYLLSKQPKSLKKNHYYSDMIHYFRCSPRLQRVRMNRRCYSLLQHATIKPENLKHLYRTYRLPKDPFFPLFLKIKSEYLESRRKYKEEKMRYIAEKMRSLPPHILKNIKFLAELEKHYHRAGDFPLWTANIFPSTKKRVREYCTFSEAEWAELFYSHLKMLKRRYSTLTDDAADKAMAIFILHLQPGLDPTAGGNPVALPPQNQIKSNFRALSKIHHPDSGGSSTYFLHLIWAKDLFIKK